MLTPVQSPTLIPGTLVYKVGITPAPGDHEGQTEASASDLAWASTMRTKRAGTRRGDTGPAWLVLPLGNFTASYRLQLKFYFR